MMADNELNVRFGGDTSGLSTAIAQAKQSVAAFAPGVTTSAKGGIDALNASLAQTKALAADLSFSAAQASIDDARASTTLLTGVLTDANAAAREMKTTWSTALFNAAVFSPVYAGIAAFRDYAASVGYSQRGTEMFTQANEGLIASIGRSITASNEYWNITGRLGQAIGDASNNIRLYFLSGLDDTEIKAIAATGALASFEAAVSRAGVSNKEFLVEETKRLESIPGLTDEAATSIIAMMTTMPDYSVEAQDVLTQFLQTFAKTSDEAVKFTKTITDAFRNPLNGGAILGDLAKQIDNVEGQLKLASTFAQRLAPDQAVAMYDRIEEKLKDSRALIAQQEADKKRILSTLILENGEEEGSARLIRDQLDLDEKRTRELDGQILRLEVQRQGWVAITEEAKKQAAFIEAIGKASTPTTRINDLDETKKALSSNSRREREDDITPAEKDAAIRVAILEAAGETDKGLLAVLNVMSNRLHASYGDYGDSLGQVVSKKAAFSAYDPAKMAQIDPNGFQYKRTEALFDKTFGDDTSDDPTGGATHYYAANAKHQKWMEGMGNQRKVDSQTFGNPDGPPVPSADQGKVAAEAIAQTNTQLREQNALREGGTEEERQSAEQAKTNLTAARDEVAEAQKLIETRKKAASDASDGSPQEQAKAAKALTEAQQGLIDKQRAQREAATSLEIAQAQDGSEKKKQLELDLANSRQSTWVQGTAQWEEQEKAKVEITQRYAKQRAADDAEIENVRFDAQQRGFREEQQQIKEQGQLRVTSALQAEALTEASLLRQAETQKSHYAKLLAIDEQYGVSTAQSIRKNAQQSADAQNKIDQERVASARNANKQIEETFKSSFESVGSTVASSLESIIERTGTFRQLMQNVAKNILSQFVSAGVKMVADWAAHQTAMVAQSLLAQIQMTGATTAGEAARTGAVTAGATAQSATKATSIIGSILASASETFAGIFGFLSPIMGPAAAGPAVAGQATVAAMAALPSFDVGAWSLPSNMVAQVHAGEMIVPAGPAAMMRAAAGGGGAAPGGKGGDMHHHTHFNVTAMDSRDVRRFFGDNAKHIIGAINDGVRSGSHLGLSKLRTS